MMTSAPSSRTTEMGRLLSTPPSTSNRLFTSTGVTKPGTEQQQDNPDIDETLEKIEYLEERIRVLERIITENKYDLKREIDKL